MPGRMHIPRGDPEIDRGRWKPKRKDVGDRSAALSCPACGKDIDLQNHEVDPNGIVSPLVGCPCGFLDHVVLGSFP